MYTNKRTIRIVFGQEITIDAEGKVVDENAIRAFTNGQCHAFALAVHMLTGWEMKGLSRHGEDKNSPNHCVVVAPDGRLLDIHGKKAAVNAQIMGWENQTPLTKTAIKRGLRYYVKPDVKAALPFARTVLEQEGYGEYIKA